MENGTCRKTNDVNATLTNVKLMETGENGLIIRVVRKHVMVESPFPLVSVIIHRLQMMVRLACFLMEVEEEIEKLELKSATPKLVQMFLDSVQKTNFSAPTSNVFHFYGNVIQKWIVQMVQMKKIVRVAIRENGGVKMVFKFMESGVVMESMIVVTEVMKWVVRGEHGNRGVSLMIAVRAAVPVFKRENESAHLKTPMLKRITVKILMVPVTLVNEKLNHEAVIHSHAELLPIGVNGLTTAAAVNHVD